MDHFSTKGLGQYCYSASVDKVVDGDTVDVTVDLGFRMYHTVRVRLYGVDTPEVRTRDLDEKARGKQASIYTTEWLERHPKIVLQTIMDRSGKYGRALGIIWSGLEGDHCLNADLLESGNATPYPID